MPDPLGKRCVPERVWASNALSSAVELVRVSTQREIVAPRRRLGSSGFAEKAWATLNKPSLSGGQVHRCERSLVVERLIPIQ